MAIANQAVSFIMINIVKIARITVRCVCVVLQTTTMIAGSPLHSCNARTLTSKWVTLVCENYSLWLVHRTYSPALFHTALQRPMLVDILVGPVRTPSLAPCPSHSLWTLHYCDQPRKNLDRER